MSVNLYLNNKICELKGFKTQPNRDNSGQRITFNDIDVFEHQKGRPYIMWNEDAVIPDELKGLVEEISWHEVIPRMSDRESGIYRYGTAECELMPADHGNSHGSKPLYKLEIKGKRLEDMRELVHMVKIGTIHPEESYEGSQRGLSRKELEEIALHRDRVLDLLHSTNEALDQRTRELANAWKKNARLGQLARILDSRYRYSLIFRSTVAKEIDAILDDTK